MIDKVGAQARRGAVRRGAVRPEEGLIPDEWQPRGRTGRIMLWAEKFCTGVVWVLLTALLLFLSAISLLVTCSVYGGDEVILYGVDQPLLHVVFLLLVLAFLVVVKRSGVKPGRVFDRTVRCKYSLAILAGGCLIWILLTGFWPSSDQRMVFESAQAFLQGDFSPWAPVGYRYSAEQGAMGYAYTYPSQNGLILFFAAAAFFFRDFTPYVLQIMNIAFLFAGILFTCRLFDEILGEKGMRGICLLMTAFLPLTFYITFVYGTIPGFACSSAALYFEYRFLRTGNWKILLASTVLICGAVFLKSNYLIVLAAMVIYLVTFGLFRLKLRFLGAAALMIILYLGSGRAMNLFLETVTGAAVDGGVPMLAWVEMGLQDGSRAPGWYNGYNVQVFSDNESNSEGTLAAVKKDLGETLDGFAADPESAKSFFLKKAESIWAEPTFQSLWIQEVKGDSWLLPGFTESLFNKGGFLNGVYVAFFDYIQSITYVGALLFLILRRKRITWIQLMPGVIFIGGFLFHMVWEAKGQYSVCYFILLIPYGVSGLKTAAERLERIFK